MISTYGEGAPCLAFIGHTDVVPSGDEAQWESDPFVLTKKNDFLVGRGTSDMKGGISCFMQAVREFIKENDISYQNILDNVVAESILIQFIWSGIPTTLVLDSNLNIISTISGEITANQIFELTK